MGVESEFSATALSMTVTAVTMDNMAVAGSEPTAAFGSVGLIKDIAMTDAAQCCVEVT